MAVPAVGVVEGAAHFPLSPQEESLLGAVVVEQAPGAAPAQAVAAMAG